MAVGVSMPKLLVIPGDRWSGDGRKPPELFGSKPSQLRPRVGDRNDSNNSSGVEVFAAIEDAPAPGDRGGDGGLFASAS